MTKEEINKKLDDHEFELMEIAKAMKERDDNSAVSATHLLNVTPRLISVFRQCNEGDSED